MYLDRSWPLAEQVVPELDVAPCPSPEWLDLPVAEFLDFLSDDIATVDELWQTVDDYKRAGLACIPKAVDADILHMGEIEVGNREDKRQFSIPTQRILREYFTELITHAQYTACLIEFGDEDQKQIGIEIIQSKVTNVAQGLVNDNEPSDLIADQMFLDVSENFRNAKRAEHELVNKVSAWLANNPNNLIDFVQWTKSEDASSVEYRAFVQAFASQHFDPNLNSLFGDYFDQFMDRPEVYQKSFMHDFVKVASESGATSEDPDLSWINFLLVQDGIDSQPSKLADFLANKPIDQLPAGIRSKLIAEHRGFISLLKQQFMDFIGKHDRLDHHTVFDYTSKPDHRSLQTGKRKVRRGRITEKPNVAQSVANIESLATEPISRVFKAVFVSDGCHDGYVAEKIQDDDQPAIEALMASRPTVNYLQRYVNEPSLRDDLEKMFEEILLQPRGNGATKMRSHQVNMTAEGNRRIIGVWHLKPGVRINKLGSTVAQKTRVFYCTWPNGDGTESLILLNIDHKKSAEKLRGQFRSTN